jgi:hypothetical protein
MGQGRAYRNVQIPRADHGYAKDIQRYRTVTDGLSLLPLVECKHEWKAIHQEGIKHTVEHISKSNESCLQDLRSYVRSRARIRVGSTSCRAGDMETQ